MIAIVYLIPFFFCLLLSVGLGHHGKWTDYLWLVIAGEAFIGILHYLFYRQRTEATEYLGSLVKSVYHEDAWTELVNRTVTRRDSKGNTYTTTVVEHRYHPEQYYFFTTRGTRIDTGESFFTHVLTRWGKPPIPDNIIDSRIKGGVRYLCYAHMDFSGGGNPIPEDDPRWVSVTERHRYKNKIRNSNSIFRFRDVSKKEAKALGLFDYPTIINHDSPCILSQSYPVTLQIQEKFRRFNGAFAPKVQMRLYILLFDAENTTASISEYQREYWQGGNKNELVVCVGVSAKGNVEWARAFSWADRQQLEAEIAQWFLRNPKLNLDEFYNWFSTCYGNWERKQFSDFKYIMVPLAGWQIIMILILSILENVVALLLILR